MPAMQPQLERPQRRSRNQLAKEGIYHVLFPCLYRQLQRPKAIENVTRSLPLRASDIDESFVHHQYGLITSSSLSI